MTVLRSLICLVDWIQQAGGKGQSHEALLIEFKRGAGGYPLSYLHQSFRVSGWLWLHLSGSCPRARLVCHESSHLSIFVQMEIDILIRSYRNDFGWLGYCLRSIHRNLKGYRDIHLIVPNCDLGGVSHLTQEKVHGTEDRMEGYLAQQVTKLRAHFYSDADFIIHVDSDCIFHRKADCNEMIEDGKAIVLREEIETPWNKITEEVLGWYDPFEYMRRMPIIYPRWAYINFNAWMEEKHGNNIENIVAGRPYRSFSEFNAMGQFLHKHWEDKIVWKHPSEVKTMCKQYWSWGGLQNSEEEVKGLLDNKA